MMIGRHTFQRVLRVLGNGRQYDNIGGRRVRLPNNSHALEYKRRFRLYDTALGSIANIANAKYPDLHAIDIGANVGDTAALIRKFADIPVLCIEGDPGLLSILNENAGRLGNITVEPSFVGVDGQAIDLKRID